MEEDGIRYDEEVELPNGHKWRKRLLDGGWCRFSKRKCYPADKSATKGSNLSLTSKDIQDQLTRGKNAFATVSSKADAEALLRELTSGPGHEGGYMNTTKKNLSLLRQMHRIGCRELLQAKKALITGMPLILMQKLVIMHWKGITCKSIHLKVRSFEYFINVINYE